MPQCAAFGCTSSTDRKEESLTLHRFPMTRPDILSQWIHNVRRENFKPNSNSRLCSRHFLPHCFREDKFAKYNISPTTKQRRLKPDAVPTEFLRPVQQQQQPEHSEHWQSTSSTSREQRFKKREHDRQVKELLTKSVQMSKPTRDVQIPIRIQSPKPTPRRKRPVSATATRSTPMFEVPDWSDIEQDPLHSQGTGRPSSGLEKRVHIEELRPSEEDQSDIPTVHTEATVWKAGSPFATYVQAERESAKRRLVPVYGTPRRTGKDHPYFKRPYTNRSTQYDLADIGEQSLLVPPTAPLPPPEPASEPEPPQSESDTPEEVLAEYLPSSSGESTDTSSDHAEKSDPSKMEKYIVFASNLEELHKFCKDCGSMVVQSHKFTSGSMVGYRIECHQGHTYTWHSQPQQNKQPIGNLLIAAAILIAGGTYAKLSAFASLMNLKFISKSLFNSIQKQHVFPVIQHCWLKEKTETMNQLRNLGSVVLAGDGRCDSPGHTAKYGSYTLMHTTGDGQSGTRKIVSMNLVQVSEVKNSNQMEPEGLRRCLKEVKDGGLDISILATDRHITISSMMKKDLINHQFDTWHVAKGITKKLTAKAQTKKCSNLSPWIQSISNHLWWACSTCEGDETLLREKWLSLVHHTTNKHRWTGYQKFHQCGHPRLTAKDKKAVRWLKPESPAFRALKEVVTDKRLLKAFSHLTKFCHTGDLEVFHNMLLKYCPKRQHFHYDAMSARLMLAAYDWNNASRKQMVDKSGKPVTSTSYSKRRKTYVLKNRYEKTKPEHMTEIIHKVYQIYKDRVVLEPMSRPDLPANIAPVPKPPKKQLEEKFKSRFK